LNEFSSSGKEKFSPFLQADFNRLKSARIAFLENTIIFNQELPTSEATT
jgi:hypothetical protein